MILYLVVSEFIILKITLKSKKISKVSNGKDNSYMANLTIRAIRYGRTDE